MQEVLEYADISRNANPSPYHEENELISVPDSLPVFIPRKNYALSPWKETLVFLEFDLSTSRLDKIHQHLWLAGLPQAARPLHRQRLLNRSIIVTEDPNEHLVWQENRIFIKPLPEYLLSYKNWTSTLANELKDKNLRRAACGLLLSYCWIICRKSDLRIAQETGLLPDKITWESWVTFAADILDNIDTKSLSDVSIRYEYGELRLSRLNRIYRFVPSVCSITNFVMGYSSGSTWYQAFFMQNFGWIFAVFAYVSVILSAMQVGLGIDQLQGNQGFQQVSRWLTIGSLVLCAFSFGLILVVWNFLFFFHVIWAWRNSKQTRYRRTEELSI